MQDLLHSSKFTSLLQSFSYNKLFLECFIVGILLVERGSSGVVCSSQSRDPGFESPFATVSNFGHFRSLHWCPSSLSGIDEYLAIDSGGNVSDLLVARNCCLARMLPREAELVSEWTCLLSRWSDWSVKRFEQSNELDTALYKNRPLFTFVVN